MRALRRLAGLLTYAAMAVALAAGLVSVLVARDAVRLARVTTGSMRPGIPVGALVASVPVDTDAVGVGDVVMFRPPAPFADADGTPVAHRVVAVERHGDALQIRTRGDANATADPWVLDGRGTTFYRVTWDSLAAGRLTSAVDPGNPRTLANFFLLPAWIVSLRLIWSDRPPPRHRRPRPRATKAAPQGV
ncbi:MAG TPA: signal peptidase I [Frankiaceae bacterium]|nr:signal peptidase I [Frankiaceae bacterium]